MMLYLTANVGLQWIYLGLCLLVKEHAVVNGKVVERYRVS
jgi:hypothetical protein